MSSAVLTVLRVAVSSDTLEDIANKLGISKRDARRIDELRLVRKDERVSAAARGKPKGKRAKKRKPREPA